MKNLSNKYLRLMFLDPNVRLCLIGLLLGVIFLGLELCIVNDANRQFLKATQEGELVKKISDMERKLRLSARRGMSNTEYRFEGITITEGVSYAVIDGGIYKVGDLIGEDIVKDIQMGMVILENEETKEIKNLYLPSWEKK